MPVEAVGRENVPFMCLIGLPHPYHLKSPKFWGEKKLFQLKRFLDYLGAGAIYQHVD